MLPHPGAPVQPDSRGIVTLGTAGSPLFGFLGVEERRVLWQVSVLPPREAGRPWRYRLPHRRAVRGTRVEGVFPPRRPPRSLCCFQNRKLESNLAN